MLNCVTNEAWLIIELVSKYYDTIEDFYIWINLK